MIIECYGVPGYGKSTVTEIIENDLLTNKKIYSSYEIIEEIQKTKIKHYRLLHKSTLQKYTFKEFIELFFYIKNKKMFLYWCRLWIMLKAPLNFFIRSLEIMALYQFCEENYKSETVVVHHGVIQNLISFVYLNPIYSIDKFAKYACNIIYEQVKYIHIEISVDNALVRLRNRKNQHGRLPKIKDDKKLLEALYFQNGIFYYCDQLLYRLSANNLFKINNDLDEDNLKQQLVEIMKNIK